jgi:hypothetical protein
MAMRSLMAMASLFVLGAAASACGDDGAADDGGRRGGLGESCTKTDDCESPLTCVGGVCDDGAGGSGGNGGTGNGGSGGEGGFTPPEPGPAVTGDPWGACDGCLDTECATAIEACDAECVAVEACIETVCRNLGLVGSAEEEGACFVQCQNAHPTGKDPHLDVVNCAYAGTCVPPCIIYPTDYEDCRELMSTGTCSDLVMECQASSDCQNFTQCTNTCATVQECLACDDSDALFNGRLIYESLEHCIATECIAESWLPQVLM